MAWISTTILAWAFPLRCTLYRSSLESNTICKFASRTLKIALIAAHFYGSLLELHQTKKKRTRILVLPSMKVSRTILLRSILIKWFRGDSTFLVTSKIFCVSFTAIPHPLHSISSNTFVVVYISKNPIILDEKWLSITTSPATQTYKFSSTLLEEWVFSTRASLAL